MATEEKLEHIKNQAKHYFNSRPQAKSTFGLVDRVMDSLFENQAAMAELRANPTAFHMGEVVEKYNPESMHKGLSTQSNMELIAKLVRFLQYDHPADSPYHDMLEKPVALTACINC